MPSTRKWRILGAALLTLVLLGNMATSVYQSGWSQGYLIGILASGEGGGALLAPYALHGRGAMPFLFGVGWLFKFGLFALLFIGLAKMIRCWSGRHDGTGSSHGHAGWHKRWHEERHEQPYQQAHRPASDSTVDRAMRNDGEPAVEYYV